MKKFELLKANSQHTDQNLDRTPGITHTHQCTSYLSPWWISRLNAQFLVIYSPLFLSPLLAILHTAKTCSGPWYPLGSQDHISSILKPKFTRRDSLERGLTYGHVHIFKFLKSQWHKQIHNFKVQNSNSNLEKFELQGTNSQNTDQKPDRAPRITHTHQSTCYLSPWWISRLNDNFFLHWSLVRFLKAGWVRMIAL